MDANLTVAAASAIKNSQIQSEAASTIAAKTLKMQRVQGDAVVELIQQAEVLSAQLASGKIDVQL